MCVLLDGEETLVKFIDCTDVRVSMINNVITHISINCYY